MKDTRAIYGAFKQADNADTLYTMKSGLESSAKISNIIAWALIVGGIIFTAMIVTFFIGIPMIIVGVIMLRKRRKFKTHLQEAYDMRLNDFK